VDGLYRRGGSVYGGHGNLAWNGSLEDWVKLDRHKEGFSGVRAE
jgi:hypothetical protein